MIVLDERAEYDDTPSPTFFTITFLGFLMVVCFVAGWCAHAFLH